MERFTIEVPIPSMGATVNELTLIDLFVAEGAAVSKGQKLAEFESDKSVFEFESPCDGLIQGIHGRAGDILPSGAPFLRIETAEASLRHLQAPAGNGAAAPAAAPVQSRKTSGNGSVATEPPPAAARPSPVIARPAGNGLIWTPRALKIASDAGIAPDQASGIQATGPGGRVSGDDVAKYLQQLGATAPQGGFAAFAEETVCVAGIGYAVPRNIRSNQEILKAFPGMTEQDIVRVTGIEERRYADESESATSLAATAVQHALAMAGVSVAEIDGIIMATLIPDQPVPSAASALARHLGIRTALAFDLNAACSGWLYALEVGRSFIRGGTARKVIVVTAELLSRITNPRDHETAFLFGDGAGAAILTDAAGGHRLNRMYLSGDAEFFEAIQRTGGGARKLVPQPGDSLDHFYLTMNGAVVFKRAVIAFGNMIEETLRRHRLTPDAVSWIVPHQANQRILRAVSKRVGIPYERFVVTVGKYGNTSAASVSMALGWAAEEGIFSSGDKIIFCSVGAGFTYAGGLLVW